MGTTTEETVKAAVREAYGRIATGADAGCCRGAGCCGTGESASAELGYTDDDLAAAPAGADLGLGCGNPHAIAGLKAGERVLDLGSGAGFDAFLAARQVGAAGRVIGVDMTPQMIDKARANARRTAAGNVEFRLGDIERLPVDAASVDVIMSNCVIDLSPDKPAVFREAFRALAPGGRLAISDVVAIAPVPDRLADDLAAYAGCISGAALVTDIRQMLVAAGFDDVRITLEDGSDALVDRWLPGESASDFVRSAFIQATKPAGASGREDPACCDSVLLDTCCSPSEKPTCCSAATHEAGTCGCR